MFDPLLRRWLDHPIERCAGLLSHVGIRANVLTITGFGIGMLAIPLLAWEEYFVALIAIVVNRILDGVDGAVARRTRATDFGGYLDIVCDLVFYAGCVVGFALARAENLVASVVLLASFVGTASTFLGYATIAAARGITTTARGSKSFYHSAGLVEGGETIGFLVAACLWPAGYSILAIIFAILCAATVAGRLMAAWQAFGPR